jgi:ABC-type bacteriocin/lantibiotic exporter with double-glycine peptidase domain
MEYPHFHQETEYTCGPACMRMALKHFGIKKSEKALAKMLKTNKVVGTWHKAFPLVAEKYKLNYVVKRHAHIDDLKEYHKKHYFIIISYTHTPEKFSHFSVVSDIDDHFIYLLDPYKRPRHKYKPHSFEKLWKSNFNYEKEKRWFFAMKK